MKKTWIFRIFFVLVTATLFTPLILSRELLFPYITTRAFYLRTLVELALPFYAYLVITKKSYRPNFKNPLHGFMLLFLFFTVVASITGVNPIRSFWGNFERMGGAFYIAHLVAVYFYVVLIGQAGGGYIKRFLQWAIGIGGVVSLEAVLLKMGVLTKAIGLSYLAEQNALGHRVFTLFSTATDPSLPDRASVTLGNPIFLASLLIIPFFIALYFGLQEESLGKRFWYFSAAFFQLLAILLSGTRGAIVGLLAGGVVAAIIYLILNWQRTSSRYTLGALGFFVVVIALLFSFHKDLPKGTTLYRLFNLKDSNSSARLIQWKSALKGFKDDPILGVGPENYYVISNKYYDPEIYKYDPSWFDKPHNYLLEILVTTGALGFLAYAGVLVFTFWALYRAYKVQFFSSLEFCLLVAAVLVYQIQNLFVFDTISASLMFFVMTGFAAFLWHESSLVGTPATKPAKGAALNDNGSFASVASVVLAVLMLYVAYVTNIVPARAARGVNYGYAYGAAAAANYPKEDFYPLAEKYFVEAKENTFNFDVSESAARYAEFGGNLVQSLYAKDHPEFAKEVLSSILEYQLKAAERSPYDPIVMEKLSSTYLYKSVYIDQGANGIDPHAEQYVHKAVDLAPNRLEPHIFLAQIKIQENDLAGAEEQLLWVKDHYPTVREGRWQLAGLYYLTGRVPEALAMYEENTKDGFPPKKYSDIQWLTQLYEDSKEYEKAQSVLEEVAPSDGNNIALFADLAGVYAKLGKKDLAISLATKIKQADPSQEKAMQEIIDSFK